MYFCVCFLTFLFFLTHHSVACLITAAFHFRKNWPYTSNTDCPAHTSSWLNSQEPLLSPVYIHCPLLARSKHYTSFSESVSCHSVLCFGSRVAHSEALGLCSEMYHTLFAACFSVSFSSLQAAAERVNGGAMDKRGQEQRSPRRVFFILLRIQR